ncbi:hypothetical protein MKZ25_10780 [Solibacillus sp. FSL W7-1464]|uniref:hypothetical protein n=1 Tax=Solibacillus sp. FSL W7-1464 TaxID=2921706 RepID=UPI0030F67A7F
MKKYVPFILSLFLLAACEETNNSATADPDTAEDSKSSEAETTNSPSKEEPDSSQSEEEVSATTEDFQRMIPSNWNVEMPTDFPVTKGSYLTAITSTDNDVLTFNFYETPSKLAINDKTIEQEGTYIGQLTITEYNTKELASEEIDQTVFDSGQAVDLGYGITGYQDAGAGSLFTSWNEGRWAIIARSLTEKAEESLNTAKETVEFLETNMLPVPKDYGTLHVDAEQTGTMAKWQKENYLYTMTDFGEDTLRWIVKFK